MAIIANSYLTFDTKGIREDLSDVISRVAPEETPVASMSGKGSAENTFFEWQQQELATAVSNTQLEGDQIAPGAVTPTVRIGNYQQISAKPFLVSATDEKVKAAGRGSEINYQKVLKGLEVRRDMEVGLTGNFGAVAGNSTTPRRSASLLAFIKTNFSMGAGGANPTYTNIPTGQRTDGTLRTFTQALFNSVAQQIYTQSGSSKTRTLLLPPALKATFSGFAGIATKTYNLNEGTRSQAAIIGAADVIVTDFGVYEVVLDVFMRARDALLLDFDDISLDYLRPMSSRQVPASVDGELHWVGAEWGLRVGNEKAHGIVADLQA